MGVGSGTGSAGGVFCGGPGICQRSGTGSHGLGGLKIIIVRVFISPLLNLLWDQLVDSNEQSVVETLCVVEYLAVPKNEYDLSVLHNQHC